MIVLSRVAAAVVVVIALVACTSTPTVRTTPTDPSLQIARLLEQGDVAAKGGQIDLAFQLYLSAERLDPKDERALVRAGNLHRMLGKRETAERAWELALERNTKNAPARESLGFLFLETGRYDEAAESFETVLEIDPKAKRAAIGLGLACEKRLDFARALQIYEEALQTDPESIELRTYRARSLMGLGRFAEARSLIISIVNEPLPVTWIVRGDLFAIEGEYAAALGAYLETLAAPWAYQRLGEHALRRQEYERAMRYFQQAAEASPDFFEDADRGLAVAREHLHSRSDSK